MEYRILRVAKGSTSILRRHLLIILYLTINLRDYNLPRCSEVSIALKFLRQDKRRGLQLRELTFLYFNLLIC